MGPGSTRRTADRRPAPSPWRNWSGTVTAVPERVHLPRSVPDVVAAVRDATVAGARLRPRGSGHSFTSLAATDGHAIDLRGFAGIEALDTATGVVRARAGTTLRALNRALEAHGLALANLGDIDAQTISGAVATGTHGTGARQGGLATQVLALDLVLADGTAVRCSADAEPDLFAASRVGLGALGVVTHVTLQCVPAFVLHAVERPERLDTVLCDLDGLFASADHAEFYWFPYGSRAMVKRNHRVTADAAPAPLSPVRRFVEYDVVENAAFGAVCRVGRAAPSTAPALGRLASSVLSTREYGDRSHRVFTTRRRVRFVESEWAVARERLGDVLAELRAVVPRLEHPVLFPVEVRVAAGDDVWLSTAYGRDTAYVAVHQYVGAPRREWFDAAGAIAAAAGGRPHWGKEHHLDATALRERYPCFDAFRRVRRDVDPGGLFTNAHLDHVLGAV
ncbi:D-arabinono-1,4-lactone oxidase [Actinomycetospora cinnamomea]|uniref:FAD-linked oxidoreductase n=1 Tax=Actinomycetospora cinnamomea TaxID=663609 RepID=A0A2U1FRE1_9PSEU|nr:D-arabinono-1,4-lactone oxidase [Actinomycetospora cinnamomea]PVZ14726.1 FAD-linked oxidoreductase [Actinomycetospora cinnamomea]